MEIKLDDPWYGIGTHFMEIKLDDPWYGIGTHYNFIDLVKDMINTPNGNWGLQDDPTLRLMGYQDFTSNTWFSISLIKLKIDMGLNNFLDFLKTKNGRNNLITRINSHKETYQELLTSMKKGGLSG